MLSRIPSWAVAVVGATIAIAIVATATSTTLLHQTRASIAEASAEVAETRREMERLWGNLVQSDQRSAAGDVFFAQALAPSPSRAFLQQQSAYQLCGAALWMRAASGEPVPDETPESIASAERLLGEGDARG